MLICCWIAGADVASLNSVFHGAWAAALGDASTEASQPSTPWLTTPLSRSLSTTPGVPGCVSVWITMGLRHYPPPGRLRRPHTHRHLCRPTASPYRSPHSNHCRPCRATIRSIPPRPRGRAPCRGEGWCGRTLRTASGPPLTPHPRRTSPHPTPDTSPQTPSGGAGAPTSPRRRLRWTPGIRETRGSRENRT